MSRIVAITGATGFLGRYIVRAFAGSGWRVRILARQPIDHPQLAGLQLEVVLGDLSNRQALRTLVDGADVIVHAAGLIKARTPAAFEAVNVRGTANLAQCDRGAWIDRAGSAGFIDGGSRAGAVDLRENETCGRTTFDGPC